MAALRGGPYPEEVLTMETTMMPATDDVTELMPWAEWPNPQIMPCALRGLVMLHEDGSLVLYAGRGDERIGPATEGGLHELSRKVDFPSEFVTKLPLELRASVINDRIQAARECEVAAVLEDGRFSALLPSVRETLTYRETAELAYDTLRSVVPEISVDHASASGRGMQLRLLTSIERPVTRRVGDILAAGVAVRQDYGLTTEISLYARRLVCLNGMTANRTEFSWTRRSEGSAEHQRLWLRDSVLAALGAFGQLVDRSRQMATTTVDGEPEQALLERARAMGLPRRHFAALIDAWRAEKDPSEWGLMNAITRLATHSALPGSLGARMQEAAGTWAHNFDIVECRLPRPVAERCGARDIRTVDGEPNA